MLELCFFVNKLKYSMWYVRYLYKKSFERYAYTVLVDVFALALYGHPLNMYFDGIDNTNIE